MPTPVTLPRAAWGRADAPRRALLVHGLGSTGALMWRFATTLADAGWHVTAVDLRGHGTAPRALDYRLAAYAGDLLATRPNSGGAWDLVVGHSLGGATATVASAADPEWARRLVLIDPGIALTDAQLFCVREGQERALRDPSRQAVRAQHPTWHEQDIELKAIAALQVSRFAIEQTGEQNDPWDVRPEAARLSVPTHVIASDPAVDSIFTGAIADEVLANPAITMSVIAGAGHSPHRDKPDATMAQLLAVLAEA